MATATVVRKTREQRIAMLKERLAKEQTAMRLVEARKAKKVRAMETRKKILLGAMILGQVEQGQWPKEQPKKMLEGFLVRDNDRALFGLPPLPGNAVTQAAIRESLEGRTTPTSIEELKKIAEHAAR